MKALEANVDMRDNTRSMRGAQVDPLYIIFEQHLLNFQDADSDRKTFIAKIVTEYLVQLRRMGIQIPKSHEIPVIEELACQVNSMLVKKIYGCLSIEEYQKGIGGFARKNASTRYRKLAAAPRRRKSA